MGCFAKEKGVRRKKYIWVGIFCLLIFGLCGCGSKAPMITYDGSFELRLGRTKAGDVLDAGFADLDYEADDKQIEDMSWESLYVMKDGYSYGMMYVGNKSLREKAFRDGVVFSVIIQYDNPKYPAGEILINGIDFYGYTKEQVKEAMQEYELTLDGVEKLVFESEKYEYGFSFFAGSDKGKYEYTFSFLDGSNVVSSISINDGTITELTER